jgi:hypothetical protein
MKMLRGVQNERFTFDIDSENALVGSTLERRLKTPLHQRSNPSLGRFKTQFAVIGHWCNFKNSQQSNREMRAAMPRPWRRPTVALTSANPIPIISYYFTYNNMK